MFEAEGDTLSQTLKSDYGNYSDVFRKAYHHETVSQCRCKDSAIGDTTVSEFHETVSQCRCKDSKFLELDCPK